MKYYIVCREDELSLEIKKKLLNSITLEFDYQNPDIVVAIGGDGTIIKASHSYPRAIIFGLHTGHLGFYTNYGIEDVDLLINDINNNEYSVEKLSRLSCRFVSYDEEVIEGEALNEVTIVSPLRTLILDVSIDGDYLERFRGTGMCVSTPSGSTAYNKSLDGSVIDPKLKVMQLTEIAGINSNSYRTLSSPLVLSEDRRITLSSLEPIEVYVTIDNQSYTVKSFKSLEVFYDDKYAKMGYHTHEGFVERITRTFTISKE